MKRAAVPMASVLPYNPAVPAIVDTMGPLNRAALSDPSALPYDPARPANVVTAPEGVILRIVWL